MLPGLGIDTFQFVYDNIDKIEPPYIYKFNILKDIKYREKIKNIIKPPYFYNLKTNFDINNHIDLNLIMKFIYGDDIRIYGTSIKDKNGKIIYNEYKDDLQWWEKRFDDKGNEIYYETSSGYWVKREFDTNGNLIYVVDGDGSWEKYEFDKNENCVYYENSEGKIMDKR